MFCSQKTDLTHKNTDRQSLEKETLGRKKDEIMFKQKASLKRVTIE